MVVREVTSLDEFDGLRDQWDDLVDRCPGAGVFQTWEWVRSCREHLSPRRQLCAICVWDEGRLVGIAPLEVTSLCSLPFRRLQFIGGGVSDYLDFIVDGGMAEPVLRCIYDWLWAHSDRWDLLDLQQIPEASPALRCAPAFPSHTSRNCVTFHQDTDIYLPLPSSWDGVLSNLGKKLRKNLSYYENLLRRTYTDVAIGVLGPQEVEEAIEVFFRLHTERWERRGMPGVAADPARRAFYRRVVRLCANRGWLRLHGLRVDGRLIAVDLGFAHKERFYLLQRSFDLEFSAYSPGTVLLGRSIREAVEDGLREYDLLRGDEPYKTVWTDQHRSTYRQITCNHRVRSRVSMAASGVDRRVGYRTRALIARLLSIVTLLSMSGSLDG